MRRSEAAEQPDAADEARIKVIPALDRGSARLWLRCGTILCGHRTLNLISAFLLSESILKPRHFETSCRKASLSIWCADYLVGRDVFGGRAGCLGRVDGFSRG